MSLSRTENRITGGNPDEPAARKKPTIILEVSAAYNRDNLPMPKPNGPNGRRVLSLEMLLHHPFYWEWLNERETEEVLMELYVARTRRMQ
jgi:hypothetical protein